MPPPSSLWLYFHVVADEWFIAQTKWNQPCEIVPFQMPDAYFIISADFVHRRSRIFEHRIALAVGSNFKLRPKKRPTPPDQRYPSYFPLRVCIPDNTKIPNWRAAAISGKLVQCEYDHCDDNQNYQFLYSRVHICLPLSFDAFKNSRQSRRISLPCSHSHRLPRSPALLKLSHITAPGRQT